MKFKLIEKFDETRSMVQEYMYDAMDELNNASLEEYIQWFKSELTYYDNDVERSVTDAYIEACDYGMIKGVDKTRLTSELKEYIKSHTDIIDDIDELMKQCPGHLQHELKLVIDTANLNESLNEGLLTESTVPAYREMFLQLLDALSDNEKFKQLLHTSPINIHHIDSKYKHRKASTNHIVNIAIMSKRAHDILSGWNTSVKNRITDKTDQEVAFTNNFYRIQEQMPNEVFDIYTCLPDFVVEIILNNNVTELV